MSLSTLEDIQKHAPHLVSLLPVKSTKFVAVANATVAPVLHEADLTFTLGGQSFTERFLVLKNTNRTLLGWPFFEKNDVTIRPRKRLLDMPDMTLSLNGISQAPNVTKKIAKKSAVYFLRTTEKISVPPNSQTTVRCAIPAQPAHRLIGVVEPLPKFEKLHDLSVTTTITKVTPDSEVILSVINLSDHHITVQSHSWIGKLIILTPEQAELLQPLDPRLLSLDASLNELVPEQHYNLPHGQASPQNFWFPTPETRASSDGLQGTEKKIHEQLVALRRLEALNPKNGPAERQQFLDKFNWNDSVLTPSQRSEIEAILVEFEDIFARHRFDVGGGPH